MSMSTCRWNCRPKNRTIHENEETVMKDLLGLMSKAKEMQALQEEVAAMEVAGQAGGGLVEVTLTGKGEMKSLRIDPSMFREDDVEVLEDLILAAHNDAKAKADQMMQDKTREMTAGLPIPPGMKLPF
jgi:nucleoid-associated protein EbfC